jgi:hypothetical protein
MSEQESPEMNEGGDMEEQLSPDQMPEGAFEGEMAGEDMGMDGEAMDYGCKLDLLV